MIRATKPPVEPAPWRSGLFRGMEALAWLFPFLAISTQSYWIDEALTALKAAQPSLAVWWEQMVAEKMSDLQMPLYMAYVWAWAKLFGTGEWVLRAANLPWFMGGLLVFVMSLCGARRPIAALLATLSSFTWFYLDEARPYAMQIGASLLLVGCVRFLDGPNHSVKATARWVWVFCGGVGVLAGTSLLGVFWSGAAVAALVVVLGRARVAQVWKAARLAWLMLLAWLIGLAGYYAWTMVIGARASAMGTTNLLNVGFVGYELLGCGGLGPGRLEIRAAGLASFRGHMLPLLVYGVLAGTLLAFGILHLWRQERRKLVGVGLIVLATFVCLLAAGGWLHFRLLGRHCAPAQAVILLWLVMGAAVAMQRGNAWLKLVLCGYLLASLGSSLSARFAERHRKDDYRAAATCARRALEAGQRVWWSADPQGAAFYGLPVSGNPNEPGRALLLLNPSAESVAAAPWPDLAVCSKPDLYDTYGTLAHHLQRLGCRPATRFSAFTLWTHSSAINATRENQ